MDMDYSVNNFKDAVKMFSVVFSLSFLRHVMSEDFKDLTTCKISYFHYENLSVQCTEIFSAVKIEKFIGKIDIFNILAQNIDCGYMFKYPQSMFWGQKYRVS